MKKYYIPRIEISQNDWREYFPKLTLWEYIVCVFIEDAISARYKQFAVCYHPTDDSFFEIDLENVSRHLPIIGKSKFDIANLLTRCQNYGYLEYKTELDTDKDYPLCEVSKKHYVKFIEGE